MSLWKTGKDRKKEKAHIRTKEKEHTRKKRDGIRTTELNRRDQVTAAKSWPSFHRKTGAKVDYQVAAPTETSTPNLHRATIAQQKSADGRVATGAAWLKGRNSQGGRDEQKHPHRKEREKGKKTYLTHTGLLMEGVDQLACDCSGWWSSLEPSSRVLIMMSHHFLLNNLARDFRYAVRSLRKDLRFTFVAVFALTLGIAATTVVFSVFYNLLFSAVAAKDAQRLVVPIIQD